MEHVTEFETSAASTPGARTGLPLNWSFCGRVDYGDAVEMQHALREDVAAGAPDYLLMLEHPPTVTLGRRAGAQDLVYPAPDLEREGITVVRTDRGGQATYHGPGQLVAYPIMDIRRRGVGIKRYVCLLEDAILATLKAYGVAAQRKPGAPGLYVGPRKIAALGIHVRRSVTTHGMALNVVTDLHPFRYIVPCGAPGLAATSLAVEMDGEPPPLEAVASVFVTAFSRAFAMAPQDVRAQEAGGTS